MPSATVNGIRLEYETFGDAGAPAILLIMGLGMQLVAWPIPFCEALARQGFRVVRYDNRDIGLSSHFDHLGAPKLILAILMARLGMRVASGYTLDDMADDAAGLMDALGIERAHVAGVSMGGMIAQQLAARHAARLRSLTSIMSTTGARGLPPATREAQKVLFSRPRNPNDMRSLVEHYLGVYRVLGSPGFPTDPEELRSRLEKSLQRSYHPQGVARQMHAIIAAGDRSAQVRRIQAPTLVIHGDCDPLVPIEGGRDTTAKVPGAKMKIVPGMGHDMSAWPVLAEAIAEHALAHN